MRKLLAFSIALLCITSAFSQVSEAEANVARQLVNSNRLSLGIPAEEINDIIITSTYKIQGREDIRLVYLQQSYKGVPVFNEMKVLAFRQDQLVSDAGTRIPEMYQKVNVPDGIPGITVFEAIQKALAEEGLVASEQLIPVTISSEGRKFEFGKVGVAAENITGELMWLPENEKKDKLRLIWQIFLAPANTSDYWLIRVDAVNGSILEKQNLTITCYWDGKKHTIEEHYSKHPAKSGIRENETHYFKQRDISNKWKYQPFVVSAATYQVIPFPAESPTHLGSPFGVALNPWTLAPGNATSLGWHNDGSTYHDSTRGNNVWAAEDRAATNATMDRAAVSTTPQPSLTFDYTPDYTVTPTSTNPPNQQFAITNLFYWNNIIHDITYLYGFNEVAGNFQNDNQGRGGLGSDYVIADAQDGGGTNNANFATPVDGTRPRMQMYLWTAPNPDRDGDLDNGIVTHEFTHGISNRLTGGPSNSSCLGNAEHGGEGWSDYFALMLTTNWAAANVGDGANPRGIGTYALGQPISGAGIRNFPYSTNMAINPLVYATTIPSQVHNRGEYWCMVLWEMTWELIQGAGINPNLHNLAGGGGNAIALKLVLEGMRLQPCSPGFIDARNAILQADTLFYGGQYSCAIWRAFAKRGMGRGASQGSSASVTDQIPSFLVDNGIFSVTESVQAVQEGQSVTYTNHITAGVCSPLTDYYITDTLPTHVTYVSGGTYNAANRTVTSGPFTLASNQSQAYNFTVSVNGGSYFPPVEHFNETVAGATLPASWIATSTSATMWSVSSVQSNSLPNAFFGPDPATLSDHQLTTTSSFVLNASPSSYTTLSFWHRFNTEDGWDGGVVEISTNGGASWSDLGSKMIANGYNGSLGGGSGNVLAGRQAFTGSVPGFIKTVINLSSYAGQTIKIRFRFSTDDNTAPSGGGWFVDDIILKSEPVVYIKSNLFTPTNLLVSTTDTITRILPDANCVPVTLSAQPGNVTTCTGNNAEFVVAASGTAPINYQWQINTGSGFSNLTNAAPYSGVSDDTLIVTGITTGMNGYEYRVLVTNSCGLVTSNNALLTVTAAAQINSQPVNSLACVGDGTTFSVATTGATGYQWQVNTGSGFTNIADGGNYSGTTTATLTISGITSGMNGYQYRVVLSSCGPDLNSGNATLTVTTPVNITADPANRSVCEGSNTSFSVTATGGIISYQWQVSTDGGTTFNNINGQTNPTLNINNSTLAMNNNQYRAVITGQCGPVNSAVAILTVEQTPTFTLQNIPASTCISDTAVLLGSSMPGGTWSGSGIQSGTFVPSLAGVGVFPVTYTVTNNAGCTNSESVNIQVNDCPERHLTLGHPNSIKLYPNPNNGNFSIWIKSDLITKLNMRVYASDGKLVASTQLSGLYYDRKVPVNMSKLSSGVYHISLSNDENGKLTKRTFNIVIGH